MEKFLKWFAVLLIYLSLFTIILLSVWITQSVNCLWGLLTITVLPDFPQEEDLDL